MDCKKCTICLQMKPLDSFFNSKKNRDGKSNQCIVCMRESYAQWRIKRREKQLKHFEYIYKKLDEMRASR